MSTHKTMYEFPESVPLNAIEPGTNVLVTGESIGGTRDSVMRLLTGSEDEGALFISPSRGGTEVIEDLEAVGGTYDPGRMAVVDCSESGAADESRNIKSLSSPSDLTGIGMTFSSLYETLYKSGFERVRIGVLTLAPLVMYVDDVQPVYRFLHTIAGRVRTADGLGIYAVDPQTLDDRTFHVVTQPFDARIEVRTTDDGTVQLRTEGLSDQPDGWVTVDEG